MELEWVDAQRRGSSGRLASCMLIVQEDKDDDTVPFDTKPFDVLVPFGAVLEWQSAFSYVSMSIRLSTLEKLEKTQLCCRDGQLRFCSTVSLAYNVRFHPSERFTIWDEKVHQWVDMVPSFQKVVILTTAPLTTIRPIWCMGILWSFDNKMVYNIDKMVYNVDKMIYNMISFFRFTDKGDNMIVMEWTDHLKSHKRKRFVLERIELTTNLTAVSTTTYQMYTSKGVVRHHGKPVIVTPLFVLRTLDMLS